MLKHTLLIASLLTLIAAGCAGPKEYGASLYRVNLDSDPPGATLYLLERGDWIGLEDPNSVAALEAHAVTEHGGVAPVVGVVVPDYQHVLVGHLGDASGRLEFKPTQHNETFVVTLTGP